MFDVQCSRKPRIWPFFIEHWNLNIEHFHSTAAPEPHDPCSRMGLSRLVWGP
jgi:hypothetical protein